LLAALLFGLATVAFDASLGGKERVVGAVFLIALTIPVASQLRTTHRQLREMTTNRIVLKADGIEIRLAGRSREWKGLSDVPETVVPWSELLSIVSEKRRFVYPSVIPLGYPLEVFTFFTKTGGFSFTRECIPNAREIAREIATRIGCEI
jgi:hypothetical protein